MSARAQPHGDDDATWPVDPAALEQLIASMEDSTDSAPCRVGSYLLLGIIGHGSMGVVHLARHVETGRLVALKVVPPPLAADPQVRRRFLREARAMSRVAHDHIVRIHDVVETDGTLAIAMEHVGGPSLLDVLRRLRADARWRGGLPPLDACLAVLGLTAEDVGRDSYAGWAAQTVRDLARGMDVVHRLGLLHRDVKPSNVLLDRRGNARLTDFSATHDLNEADTPPSAREQVVGTAPYASPEQLRGERELDARTDVYGLGATLYEMLTLRAPVAGPPAVALRRVEDREVAPVRRLVPQVPRELARIVECAIDPDRRRRYASAAQLADDLDSFLQYRPVRARGRSPAAHLAGAVRRRPARAMALLALSVTACFVGWAASVQGLLTEGEQRAKERRTGELVTQGFLLLDHVGSPAQARACFERALEIAPEHPTALAGLAIALAEAGLVAEGVAVLDAAPALLAAHPALVRLRDSRLRLHAFRPDVDGELIRRDVRVGDASCSVDLFLAGLASSLIAERSGGTAAWRTAASLLKAANDVDEDPPEIYFTALLHALDGADDEEALDLQALVIRHRFPESWTAAFHLGRAFATRDPEFALARCEDARRLGGDAALTDRLEARIRLALGDEETACRLIARRLDADPADAQAIDVLLGDPLSAPSARLAALAESRLGAAAAALRAQVESCDRSDQQGITAHRRLLNTLEHRLRAWHAEWRAKRQEAGPALAALEHALDQIESSALPVARAAVRVAPESHVAHGMLGFWLADTTWVEANRLRELAAAGESPELEALRDRVRSRLAEARQHLEQAYRLAPYDAAAARDFARFLIGHLGAHDLALEPLQRRIELGGAQPSDHFVRGLCLARIGCPAEAAHAFERALADTRPADCASTLFQLAGARFRAGDADGAARVLDECQQRAGTGSPIAVRAASLAAALHATRGVELDAALAAAREAVASRPADPDARVHLAMVHYARGEHEAGDLQRAFLDRLEMLALRVAASVEDEVLVQATARRDRERLDAFRTKRVPR